MMSTGEEEVQRKGLWKKNLWISLNHMLNTMLKKTKSRQLMDKLTYNDSKAVDNANSPKLMDHLQWYSEQQLKHQV